MAEEKVPFFKKYYLNIRNKLQEQQLEEFEKLNSDEERINFVSKIISVDFPLENDTSKCEKSDVLAKKLKELGNKAFGEGDFMQALELYTDSILTTPQNEGTTNLALTTANRSAALFHLQEYQTAIKDIDMALSLKYPDDLKYKVLERKARCLLALKNVKESMIEFKNSIQALSDSNLPPEKKKKIEADIQLMLSKKDLNSFAETKMGVEEPKLSSSRSQIYEAACDKVEIKEELYAGRFATAAEDIEPGATILIEKAYCSVLLEEFSKTNCLHCFKRTIAPFPCKNCSKVIFCSSECKELAESTYHKYECKILDTLKHSGVSLNVLLALRIITQQHLEYFLGLSDELNKTRENMKIYKTSDYLNIYNLVRHEKLRKRDDFFERTVMALFLVDCLKKGNYFKEPDKAIPEAALADMQISENQTELTAEEKFIGGLVLRHLQILQFNAHEIFELEMKENDLDQSKTVLLGGGLYTTLALFNHSCDPGILRYFDGTKIIVRSIKPIKKGEIIAENYGPIYSQTRKEDRQKKLKLLYWFDCNCIPCTESWPTFDEIDQKVIRFRCDARKKNGEKLNDCKNVIPTLVTDTNFGVKCAMCGQLTNTLKGLKILQETDSKYQLAKNNSEKRNYQEALAIYLEVLSMLHSVLAPPFRDFLLCQQSIRKCMLTLGNKYIKQ